MDTISVLLDFIEKARGERKYAESTARGYSAAVKLFAAFVSDAERVSFQTLLQSIDNIAADIYAKQADENITVTTLVVYKRRMRKLIADYHAYGTRPEAMSGWNPRRYAAALKKKPEEDSAASHGQSPVLLKPSRTRSSQTGVMIQGAHNPSLVVNRSEISLRRDLRLAIELPVDMTEQEAAKITQLIHLMLAPAAASPSSSAE